MVNIRSTVGRCEAMKNAKEHTKGNISIGESWQKHAEMTMITRRHSLHVKAQYKHTMRENRTIKSRRTDSCSSQSMADVLRFVWTISVSSSCVDTLGMAMATLKALAGFPVK